LDHEFARRMEQHKVGSELLLLLDGHNRLQEFQKLLSVDKIKSFNLREQSADDIQQSAVTNAFSAWNNLKSRYSKDPYQPPEFPFDMLPQEKEFWRDMMINRVWTTGKEAHMSEMISLLTGETEAIPEIVRARLREEWRTIKRRKEIIEGQPSGTYKGLDPVNAEQIGWSIIPEKTVKWSYSG
jgi:hypothetical protein